MGVNARETIRKLDALREKGSLYKGARIAKGKGMLYVKLCRNENLPGDLDLSIPDNEIIAVALNQKDEHPRRKAIVVTRDINMRVICDAIGLISEDYTENEVIKKEADLYTGFKSCLVDDQVVDFFYAGDPVHLDPEEHRSINPNQFVMLVSSSNEKKTALCRFSDYLSPLEEVQNFKDGLWGVKARNKEQMFALDVLLDPDIPIGDTAEEVATRWTYLTNKYGNDNICYRPSKGEK